MAALVSIPMSHFSVVHFWLIINQYFNQSQENCRQKRRDFKHPKIGEIYVQLFLTNMFTKSLHLNVEVYWQTFRDNQKSKPKANQRAVWLATAFSELKWIHSNAASDGLTSFWAILNQDQNYKIKLKMTEQESYKNRGTNASHTIRIF